MKTVFAAVHTDPRSRMLSMIALGGSVGGYAWSQAVFRVSGPVLRAIEPLSVILRQGIPTDDVQAGRRAERRS